MSAEAFDADPHKPTRVVRRDIASSVHLMLSACVRLIGTLLRGRGLQDLLRLLKLRVAER
jgi:hypothetical protein